MSRPGRVALAALALAAAVAGCGAGRAASRPLRVEYSGCESVWRGPVCRLGESRRLRLWVEAPPGWHITVDGKAPADPPAPLEEGLVLAVEVPAGARETVVEASGDGEVRSWRLALEESRPAAWYAEAQERGMAGDLAGARRAAEPYLAAPAAAERGLAWRIAALGELALGGEERAEEALRRAIAAHRDAGALSREIRDGRTLAQRLILRRDFTAARAVLEALPDPAGYADSAHHRAYTLGILASEVGDLRSALDRLREAEEHAARAGLLLDRIVAGQVLARELQRVGRSAEANELFARLAAEAEPLSPCFQAQLRNNRAWALLLAREAGAAGGAGDEDPKPLLDEALEAFEGGCSTFPDRDGERVNVRVNLALAHLQEGAPEGLARQRLAEARDLQPRPDGSVLLWWNDLEARVHLAAGEPARALAAWRGLAERAREAAAPEAAWRAASGEARAREALGDVPAALAAYRQAEDLLERESLLVPMHQGRDTFLGQREEATRRQLDLLLRAGRPAEALAAARRARSRFLRSLEVSLRLASLPTAERRAWDRAVAAHQAERAEMDQAAAESWRLPGDELARALEERARRLRTLRGTLDTLLVRFGLPKSTAALPGPAPGEILLAWYPLPDGWAGFAADATGVTARRLGRFDATASPPVLAARLLAPFARPIAAARRVRILPSGALRGVDVHSLPFGGDALLAAKPVVYGLDLAQPAGSPSLETLIVGDPEGNLPGARAEAEKVEAALAAARPAGPLQTLLGGEATGPAVRPLLAGSGAFHYAGHAVFDGWNSFLPLAGGGRLTVDDVLALRRAPARVVLSGCETGASSGEGGVESIGLAHAFLAAGAQVVIAAVRSVPDEESAALMAAFYAELSRGAPADEALRRAQLALRAGGRSSAGFSFRAFVP